MYAIDSKRYWKSFNYKRCSMTNEEQGMEMQLFCSNIRVTSL